MHSAWAWARRVSCACGVASAALVCSAPALLLSAAWSGTPLSRAWPAAAQGSSPWSAARWRGGEAPYATEPTYAQWYYVMLTDAATNETVSVGLGGFAAADESGGWLRRRRFRGAGAPEPRKPPTLSLPYAALRAAAAPDFDVQIGGSDSSGRLRLRATSATTLSLTMSLPPPEDVAATVAAGGNAAAWAWAELELERVYGVSGGAAAGGGAPESCVLANIPFAYDSVVRGAMCMAGGCGRLAPGALGGGAAEAALVTGPAAAVALDASPRWRAYVESTVTCGQFPRPGAVHGHQAPQAYPWKWMWAVAPPAATGLPPRGGTITGEIGLVMSHARLAVPLPAPMAMLGGGLGGGLNGSLAPMWQLDLDVDATFAYVDLPAGGDGDHPARLGGINVSAALASAGGGALVDWALERALLPAGGLGLLRAAPPGAGVLRAATVEHGDWGVFADAHGSAALPMRQTLRITTDDYALAATFATNAAHYVRLAVAYDAAEPATAAAAAHTRKRIVSDFRAAAASAYLRVAARGDDAACMPAAATTAVSSSTAAATEPAAHGISLGASCRCADWDACASSPAPGDDADRALLPPGYGKLLFQGYLPHNALEFAYHADFDGAPQA